MRTAKSTTATTALFDAYGASWRRHLLASNRAEGTITVYLRALRGLATYVIRSELPRDPRQLNRAQIEGFLVEALTCRQPHTVRREYVILRAFFKWLVSEGEIAESPMAHTTPPKTPPITPAPVLNVQAIQALLNACAGNSFQARRDQALLRTLLDTGLRRAELTALALDDVHLDGHAIDVRHGKGDKPRTVFIGAKTVKALDRYLRARAGHKLADSPALWLSSQGRLSPNGLHHIVKRLARLAGIGDCYAHLFRHTWAHLWRDGGGSDSDLMTMAGWTSLAMASRYGASAQVARAQKAHRMLSPGDRF